MKVIFPGTFDPITLGHVNLVKRACNLFEHVIVGIADNKRKKPLFDIEHRVQLTKVALKEFQHVEVISFSELLVDFAAKHKTKVILRGVRAVSDFEYELQLANMNRRLDQDIESVFLTPSEQFGFVSSSLIKEIAALKGDVTEFVPENVAQALKEKY
jgi:pantetheine-phosphate adenylyltransferase